jgi:beta-glucosidase
MIDIMPSIEELLGKMSIEEKISLLSGKDFWHTRDFPELGIPSIEVADGPCGLRKQKESFDHMGFYGSQPATAYPCGPALASSWDDSLVRRIGMALGEECNAFGVDILLGPAMNIQRSPLCGRNFEYFSEDPFLTGGIAAAFSNGVQDSGAGACLKHYAANNQETEREYINAVIDERALREIYLRGFELAIKRSSPHAVMTALNKVNGEYCSQSVKLLKDILRDEWGYDGIVISDWWGVDDRAKALCAGLDIEMPYSDGVGAERIRQALISGDLGIEVVDGSCKRIIKRALSLNRRSSQPFSIEGHHELARQTAEESIVLLKNEDKALPLNRNAKLAVIGCFAIRPKYRLVGSALVNPTREDIPFDEIRRFAKDATYEPGWSDFEEESELLLEKAATAAKEAETAVIFAGLPDGTESEGHDRKHMRLPESQARLIEAVAKAQPNTIVVLANGGPVEMPWNDSVKGVFECFFAGQGMGCAIAKLLFGEVNPSGKLPVTLPKTLLQTPCHTGFPGDKKEVRYSEGTFVGYRHYDKAMIDPLYPFGHGLSYTEFEICEVCADKITIHEDEGIRVSALVRNIGSRAGAAVVQVYCSGKDGREVKRPIKELCAYGKTFLLPGESRWMEFEAPSEAFCYYDTSIGNWHAASGEYEILTGFSSRDIRSAINITLKRIVEMPQALSGWSLIGRLRETSAGRKALEDFKNLIDGKYCNEDFRSMLNDSSRQNELDKIPIRFLTLNTQTVINNEIIEKVLNDCNEERISEFKKARPHERGLA